MTRPKPASPLPLDGPCGCDSGLTYGECCKQKGIVFLRGAGGQIFRQQVVQPELETALQESAARFKEIFGRKMRDEPFLFESVLDGEEDRWNAIRETGRHAGIPEVLTYAWRRTGLLVSEENKALMSDNHLQEWNDAVEEYHSYEEEGVDPFHVFTYLNPVEYAHFRECVSLIDNVIVVGFHSIRKKIRFADRGSYYQHRMFSSALNSMRTIRNIFESRYDDDCLAILRGIYEQYLRIKLLRVEPGSVERFDAAVHGFAGIWHYKARKNGTADYSVVVDPATG